MVTSYVPPEIIRELFNQSQYPELIAKKELTEKVFYSAKVSNQQRHCLFLRYGTREPRGTKSKRARYYDAQGQWVFTVHYYRRPDGNLGASGLMDPKRLKIGDVTYIADEDV